MKFHTAQQGFSLVETLVAITILLIVIVGPMTISATAARSTSFSSEQVIAFFLAQEGAELVQKVRDDLVLENGVTSVTGWEIFTNTHVAINSPLANCLGSDCGLMLDNTDTGGGVDVRSCGDCELYYDDTAVITAGSDRYPNRARYTYTSVDNELTPYTRTIRINTLGADEAEVISTVTWRTGAFRQEQRVEIKTYLFNVYGN